MKVMKYGFFGKLRGTLTAVKEVPVFMKLATAILALVCLFGGLLALAGVSDVFLDQAAGAVGQGVKYAVATLKGLN